MNPDSIDMLVKSPDPISEKIIKLVSKYNALDECMAAVKKGFEKNSNIVTSVFYERGMG